MTESENVAIVRRAWEAYISRDNEAALALYDPEVELDFTGGAVPIYGRYKGLEGVREFFRDWLVIWQDYGSEIEELIDAGDEVIALMHEWGRGRQSGVPVDFRQVHVWTLRDGKLLRLRVYDTREEALAAVDVMSEQAGNARRFLALHEPGRPLLMPNPWDVGSAKLLESLGFEALATTSSGFAATLGRLDYGVARDAVLAHCAELVGAVGVPLSADLESGHGHEPEEVAQTIKGALAAGLAGCSIEDYTGDADNPIYEIERAAERIAAAAEAAHAGDVHLVLTARAENFLHHRKDLADTIARLQAYQEAGADVLYAPGLSRIEDIKETVASLDKPVNVLARPGAPSVAELAEAGVARISVGGAFAFVALGAVVDAANELRNDGTYSFWEQAGIGFQAAREAFDE